MHCSPSGYAAEFQQSPAQSNVTASTRTAVSKNHNPPPLGKALVKARIHWPHAGGIELQYIQLISMTSAPSKSVRAKLRVSIYSIKLHHYQGRTSIGTKEGDGKIMQPLCLINQRNESPRPTVHRSQWRPAYNQDVEVAPQSNWQHDNPDVGEPPGPKSLVSYVTPRRISQNQGKKEHVVPQRKICTLLPVTSTSDGPSIIQL